MSQETALLRIIDLRLKHISTNLILLMCLIWFMSAKIPLFFFMTNKNTKVVNTTYYQTVEIEGERFIIQNINGIRQIVGKLEKNDN